jgi:uncharacterized lipoprotein
MMRALVALFVAAAFVGILAGCSSGSDENIDVKAEQSGEQATTEAKPATE